MRVGVRNPKDFWSGVIFFTVGMAFVILARRYHMGTAMRMGPAYFPTVLGGLLALLGGVTFGRALLTAGQPVGQFACGKLALILGSSLLFGMLLRRAGLVPSLVLLVMMSAYASRRFSWRVSLPLAVAAAAFCAVTFVKLLGLPIPLYGTWFGG